MADETIASPAAAPEVAPVAVPQPTPEVSELDQALAFLNAHGSKLDAEGRVSDADYSTPVAEPAAEPEVLAATDAPDPADPNAAREEELEEELEEESTRPEANNFRVNLKDAADGERKRALIRLLKNEPGIDLAEAARRVGVSQAAAAAATAAPPAAAPAVKDPLQTLREEIAGLERQEEVAATAFDQPGIVRLNKELRTKQAELVRAEVRADLAREAAATAQTQAYDTTVHSSWEQVAESYPDAGTPGTALHNDLSAQVASIHQTNPAFFSNPEWPAMLTAYRAQKLGLAPKAPAAAAPVPNPNPTPAPGTPAAPVAAVVPRKPSTPAPPAPAPGRARSVTPAPALAVPDTDDADVLFAFLNAHGTRSP